MPKRDPSPDALESAAVLNHPTAGPCKRDPGKIAIRWQPNVSRDSKAALLARLGLRPVTAGPADVPNDRRNPSPVNNTDGLWFAEGTERDALGVETLAALEADDTVTWIEAVFRTPASDDLSGLFTVNPTRLYLNSTALGAAGGPAALGAGITLDDERSTRLPGLTVIRIDNASLVENRGARSLATRAAEVLGSRAVVGRHDVRFENIPLLSPSLAVPACRPPTTELKPNDPAFPAEWHLPRINAPRGWTLTQGDPAIVVAVLDEGVELGHPDLTLFPLSWNASTDTPDGSPTGNHGTACAGIVAGRINNGIGVAGVAGRVQVMAIATATWADMDIAEGLYFAADNGARVVSMSFGVYPSWNFWDFDVVRDGLQYANDRGLVLVAASGNENGAVSRFPGSDSRTICVGGVNRDDLRKAVGDTSSEAWWGASYGPDLDVVAPCLEIRTTDRLGNDGYAAGDYYDFFNGTSSATPQVAGLAALVISLRPELDNETIREIIETTCDKVSPGTYTYGLVGTKPNGTWNDEVGYGRINVERALLAACARAEAEEECSGCSDDCTPRRDPDCVSPKAPPWLPFDRCLFFYETRTFRQLQQPIEIRVTYEHCLRLLGRQQGGLLFTTTLLPGESVKIYQYDRFRRIRSDTERMSVHASFRQSMSALSQTRNASSSSAYTDLVTSTRSRTDTDISIGGGLAGFLGAPSGSRSDTNETNTSLQTGAAVNRVAEQFAQISVAASQALDAERSVVVSTYEESDKQEITQRTFKNDNHCYAVTYFVRRVLEVYEASTRVLTVEYRVLDDRAPRFGQWRANDDLADLPGPIREAVRRALEQAPKEGQRVTDPRQVTLPTDGTLYEAELAHCSSCEPARQAEVSIDIDKARSEARKACLEVELLELELKRRRALLARGELGSFATPAPLPDPAQVGQPVG